MCRKKHAFNGKGGFYVVIEHHLSFIKSLADMEKDFLTENLIIQF